MKGIKKLTIITLLTIVLAWACVPGAWQRVLMGSDVVYLEPLEVMKEEPCKQTINYAPSATLTHHTPTRYIKVRFLFVAAQPGLPNFIQPHEAAAYAHRMIEIVNYKLTLNEQMRLPVGNQTPVLPTNYRFVVYKDPSIPNDAGVDYAYDSTLAYFNIKRPENGSYDNRAYEKYATHKGDVLNIVLLEHHPDSIKSPTYKASSTGTGFGTWVKIVGAKQFLDTIYKSDGTTEITGHRASIFLHESGHSFGLMHTWSGNDGCDDTPNHPNCWDSKSPSCPDGVYSNNFMDYNNSQSAFTPCQLGKIHYAFSRIGSVQRKYLVPMWCDYKEDSTIYIWGKNVFWNSARDLEGDVVVQNGGMLTIRCRVSMPPGAKIVVKPKGTLVLDGAHLTNLCDKQWYGIELWGAGKDTGTVIIYQKPTIEMVLNPIDLSQK